MKCLRHIMFILTAGIIVLFNLVVLDRLEMFMLPQDLNIRLLNFPFDGVVRIADRVLYRLDQMFRMVELT